MTDDDDPLTDAIVDEILADVANHVVDHERFARIRRVFLRKMASRQWMLTGGHTHQLVIQKEPVRLATGPPPEHTIVYVFVCGCGATVVWPRMNYQLVTPDARAAFEDWLAEDGRWLHT